MGISVTGLGSGLDYESWIEELVAVKQEKIDDVSDQVTDVKSQQSKLSDIEDNYKSLQSAIKTLTDALSADDVFNQKTATSTSDAVSVAVTSGAAAQNVKVSVSQLATATTAESSSAVASYLGSDTLVSNVSEGAVKAGTFSVYVGGTKSSIDIATTDTMDNVLTKLNAIDGVSASLSDEGELTIAAESGYTLTSVGSSSDTSNFSDVMSLTRDTSTGAYSSSKSIFDTNTSAALTEAEFANGTITAGTFTIGDTSFTIDESTTLDSIIAKINDSDCGATAAWDSNSGKLVLTATDEGAVSINVTAGDGTVGDTDASNFTDIMGLTTSTWDGTDGSLLTTGLATDSQDLGTNAILKINGTTITSSSNTVTSDISGVAGLTLTLNNTTSSTATVAVAADTSKAVEAITAFVSAFNMAITSTDDATGTDGDLHGETILKSLRNGIRSAATTSVSFTNVYKTLASIGITTGDFTTDTKADTNSLSIDTDKLTAALTSDPDAVKALLIGDESNSDNYDGILSSMLPKLNNALNPSNGYFATRDDSYDIKINNLNDKVTKMTDALESYHDQLDAKFQAMDTLIAALQSQASVFDSYFNNDSDDD